MLLGPSGCGKTTALRMVAGLESVTSGRILIGDRDVTHVLPKYRDVAMVFQSYALYPHMTVAENIGYPLKLRGVAATERDAAVRDAAGKVHLEDYPRPLSAPALRRPAPARRARPRHGAAAERLPDGRAALQPRRQAARLHALRAEAPAGRSRRDDDLRHARPDRGDDARAPRRHHEQGRRAADRRRRARSTTIRPTSSSPASSARRR